jgi:hypothetical protein
MNRDPYSRLHSISITAFMENDTTIELQPPREFAAYDGEMALTDWILRFGVSPRITLHVPDPAKLWELHDLIAATLPPRAEGGASDA